MMCLVLQVFWGIMKDKEKYHDDKGDAMDINSTIETYQQQELTALLEQLINDETLKADTKHKINHYIKNKVFMLENLNETVSHTFQAILLDKEGYITYVDALFAKKLGYEEDELLKHHYRILHAAVHDPIFYEEMWNTIKEGHVWQGDICTASKTNDIFWYRTMIIPVKNELGRVQEFMVFRTNITDVKQNDKRIIEQLDDDYKKVLAQMMNLTFRVNKHKKSHTYQFRLFEGKLKYKLLKQNSVNTPEGLFLDSEDLETITYFDQAFQGEEISFKHQINHVSLYTTLTPVFENGKVIEIIGSSSDISLLQKAEQRAKRLAYYDSLTELPNRSKFRKDLEREVNHHNGKSFAVVYCDIDRLKYINDTLGEAIGDQIIDVIAKRIDKVVAGRGTLYRYGGDEFVLVLRADEAQITEMADHILKYIKQPITIQGNDLFVTASIGISQFHVDAFTSHDLVKHASMAVHYCKINGRNTRLFYTDEMHKDYNETLILDADIRKALQRNEFELHYQPQINVITNDVIGLEALIRWHHPIKGPISPATFIPLAEESGVITQIGEWVINEACRQHCKWIEQGFKPIRIAVNVSAIELQRVDFADQVALILTETKMDPSFLEIEITENSVMQNTEDCIQTMNLLRKMGVSLSIDDFGTGYSSFGYLKQFPINYLKIDQSFIRSALKEQSSAAIVRAMIQLAHNFGLKVVAEGVEEESILQLLRTEECDFYQGYFYSKPMSAVDLEENVLALII